MNEKTKIRATQKINTLAFVYSQLRKRTEGTDLTPEDLRAMSISISISLDKEGVF
jgi:hypothetical protein